jgi:hypothetical protein
MKGKTYITKKLIIGEITEELGPILEEEFGIDRDLDPFLENFIIIEKGGLGVASYPIKIETLIRILQEMRDLGSTHVELDYHCDHNEYNLTGFHISESTEEEIREYEEEKENAKRIAEKRKALLKELYDLDGKTSIISSEDDLPFCK